MQQQQPKQPEMTSTSDGKEPLERMCRIVATATWLGLGGKLGSRSGAGLVKRAEVVVAVAVVAVAAAVVVAVVAVAAVAAAAVVAAAVAAAARI